MTTNWTSTMGAPLSEEESEAILDAWRSLRQAAEATVYPDPLEMLSYCNDVVMHIYEVRRAIDRGWYAANRRAVPKRPPPPAVKRSPKAAPAAQSPEQLLAALRALGLLKGAPKDTPT